MKIFEYVVTWLVIILILTLGIEYEIWRWHLFQQTTQSMIPFWEYLLLFDR